MWKLRLLFSVLLLCSAAALVAAQRSGGRRWQTLSGDAPLVVARGGFSGLLPDSSFNAYGLAGLTSVADWISWCDVQLTKDGFGICFPDVKLDNASDADIVFKNKRTTYSVNGVPMQGWFTIDYRLNDLRYLTLKQGIYSRPNKFDGAQSILTVQEMVKEVQPPQLWLNIQHDAFYTQHNLSMRSVVISISRSVIVNYISSPEVNFLTSIAARFRPSSTKLIFRFLGNDIVEPSTNQTYGSLLSNLTFIKTFASGILIPKSYVWPVDSSQYLLPYTSVVLDAHRLGLEVFASDFANDFVLPYNYSYDPVNEYLSFVDNGNFSVDGVLSDFPVTPSSVIDCFSHVGRSDKSLVGLQIISLEGASGDYPGCTDIAYNKAVSDGADILDCPVQMTKDGQPFCLGSVNLADRTDAAQTDFSNLTMSIPELNIENGIFVFNLTWSEIQSLKPAMFSPYVNYSLYRNPKNGGLGKLMLLSDFLAFANNATSVSGVLISIENAAYLAERQGLDVTAAVLQTLNKGGYSNQTAKKVMIGSSSSSVLMKFKRETRYELVYKIDEDIRDITNSTILDIKKFATSVIVSKQSVFPDDAAYLTGSTDVVPKLQAFNLSVYVYRLTNEFVSQPWDFFSDPYVEINSYALGSGVNGIITDFPATSARYRKNRCLGYKSLPPYMTPVEPGSLFQIMTPQLFPPAEAPNPVLTESDVTEPPLPPVADLTPTTPGTNGSTAAGPTAPNGQPTIVASVLLNSLAILATALVFC